MLPVPAAQAQPFDGSYTGTIFCGLLTHLTRPLQTKFLMTVSGSTVSYEREILSRGSPTGSYERGSGTVTDSGEVALRGKGEGTYVFDAEYQGTFNGSAVRLAGTQSWRVGGDRTCQIELTQARPKS